VLATVLATVREWHAEEGWGVLDAPGCPGGAWVHLSVITGGDGGRTLDPGEWVRADITPVKRSGFDFRAQRVQRLTGRR
jgi:CspA family cold shock protein